jgi:hypothetical protein
MARVVTMANSSSSGSRSSPISRVRAAASIPVARNDQLRPIPCKACGGIRMIVVPPIVFDCPNCAGSSAEPQANKGHDMRPRAARQVFVPC